MKQATQERLLDSAIRAYNEENGRRLTAESDAKAFETMAAISERERDAAYRSFPLFFLLGIVFCYLGITLVAYFWRV